MPFQPHDEKEEERKLIRNFANKRGGKVIRLQDDNDNGQTDGIIDFNDKEFKVEGRRKGYPNHHGKVCNFKGGWENELLRKEGIFLNERTIRNNSDGFIFIVDINGYEPRFCIISSSCREELLKQSYKEQRSTNSGKMQSVKMVPLSWFKEY